MKSSLEELLANQLRSAGIAFEREFKFCPWRKWRADVRVWRKPILMIEFENIPDTRPKILVEVQGGGFVQGRHSRGMGLERDCEKMATAAALGWRVLPVTGRMVKDGRALALIEAALGVRPLEAPQAKPKARRSGRLVGGVARRRKSNGNLSLPLRVRKAAGLA